MQRRDGETREAGRCTSIGFRKIEFEDESRWEGFRWEDEPVRCTLGVGHEGWCRHRQMLWLAKPGARVTRCG